MFLQPKKPAPAATTASKKAPKKEENSLFQRTPKNFGIGNKGSISTQAICPGTFQEK